MPLPDRDDRGDGRLIPQFERASSHKVLVEYGTVGAITNRIRKGDAADIVIVSRQQIDDLQKEGTIVAGSQVVVARVGYALYVRQGAPKPDIQSVEALRRWLLTAKSIAYGDPAGGGQAAIYASRLMERLGIATAMKPKTTLVLPGDGVLQSVARGDAGIGATRTTRPASPRGASNRRRAKPSSNS